MIALILIVAAVAVFALIDKANRRIARLERAVDALADEVRYVRDALPIASDPPPVAVRASPAQQAPPPGPAPSIREMQPAPPPDTPIEPELPARRDLERLVGRTLPIWVGGAALAIGGFYIVRLAIEAGLLSPPVRVTLAVLFGLALVALGELAARAPCTADDPRVAQALAGAGTASLYAAAYLSSAVYALISPLAAFLLMAAVTAGALALALRRGAPVAIMGLVGGFATPLLAGGDAHSVIPLLTYLALLVAGLFALAIRGGWLWLSLAASAGSLGWALALILTTRGGPALATGVFALLLAMGAGLATPAGEAAPLRRAILRGLPVAAGLGELALLVARSGSGLEAWGLYLALSLGTIWLGAREARLTPLVAAALALALATLAGAGAADARVLFGAGGIALLFGGAGHGFARRQSDGPLWAGIGAVGLIAPPLIVAAGRPLLLAPGGWAAVDLLLALAPLHLAWRARGAARRAPPFDAALQIAAGAAALLLVLALAHWPGARWAGEALLLAGAALAIGGRATGDAGLARQGAVAALLALLAGGAAAGVALAWTWSLAGGHVPLPMLPAPLPAIRLLVLPSALLLATAGPAGMGEGARKALVGAAALGIAAGAYVLLKQPFAIRDEAAFVARGFAERALLSQLLFALAAAALLRGPSWARALGIALGAAGLARVVWFDLLLLDPAWVAQAVGGVPLANLLVLHFALATGWTALAWSRAAGKPRATLLAALVAIALGGALLGVRQAAHGSILAGGAVSRDELYGYSLAGLAVAVALLGGGARARDQPMRLAGLGLLTLVVLKVFLVDAAALAGALRIVSFLGLGAALIAIGWAYGRYFGRAAPAPG